MPYSIMIDAGHGGNDPGAVYKGRREKDDNFALAMEVGRILSENGVDVLYTRTTDDYISPFERARLANEAKVDFFISFHRNSSPEVNQYNGVEVLVYDKNGIKYEMAQNIVGALGELGFREIGVQARPGLVVLRKTKMPAVLVEAGFLDHEQDNRFFDQNFQKVAQAIADGILEAVKLEADGPAYYQIQVGAYKNRQEAERLAEQLKEEEYPAFLVAEDGWFKVRVGAYLNLDHAAWMEKTLRAAGYPTFMVKEREK